MQIASRTAIWREGFATGTTLVVCPTSDNMTVRVEGGQLAPGSGSVAVSWGDGREERLASFLGVTHTYTSPGEHWIRISDDLKTFGYTYGSDGDANKQMLREVVSVGSKVRSISYYGFNNCRSMRGVIDLPGVTYIGNYAFGSACGITDFILPSMTRLQEVSFYTCPTASRMYCDGVTDIGRAFWGYYGGRLTDMYIRGLSCLEIQSMSGFPFGAGPAVRFHGSDGTVTPDGQILQG